MKHTIYFMPMMYGAVRMDKLPKSAVRVETFSFGGDQGARGTDFKTQECNLSLSDNSKELMSLALRQETIEHATILQYRKSTEPPILLVDFKQVIALGYSFDRSIEAGHTAKPLLNIRLSYTEVKFRYGGDGKVETGWSRSPTVE